MASQPTALGESRFTTLCLLTVLWSWAAGCESEYAARPGWTGPMPSPSELPSVKLVTSGGSGTTHGTAALGGASSTRQSCVAPATGSRPHEAGNYDNRSCNSPDCHETMIGGGWVYASPRGIPWIGGATITITNSDGSTSTAVSAADGFFQITKPVTSPYSVCVSKCPGVDCSVTPHPNGDCQTSNCHGNASRRVYVSQNAGGASNTGGASSIGGGQNCAAPKSGGPYTHSEFVYGNQPCSGSGCHSAPKAVFEGGFLYDGPTSTVTVPEATITLTPASGSPVTAVTGPDGMFFFGTVSTKSAAKALAAPYTACVSKCPLRVCSITNGHTTTEDCQTSKCHNSDVKVYLR